MLAQAVLKAAPAAYQVHVLSRPEIDITDAGLVFRVLRDLRPDIVINCASYTRVDECEAQAETAMAVNGEGPKNLALAAGETGSTLVHVSSDYVFSGEKDIPYRESDLPGPLSVYGRSKLAGEEGVFNSGLEKYFIVRTGWLYGPGGRNFVETMVRLGKAREELRVVADQQGTPTATRDLARAIFNLLELPADGDNASYGTYHFSNEGTCSWHGFAKTILEEARAAGEPIIARRVVPIDSAEYALPAKRPQYSVLSTDKYRKATGAPVPHWRESLAFYFRKERK